MKHAGSRTKLSSIRSLIGSQKRKLLSAIYAGTKYGPVSPAIAFHQDKDLAWFDCLRMIASAIALMARGHKILWRVVLSVVVQMIGRDRARTCLDRKSTRLNSSH